MSGAGNATPRARAVSGIIRSRPARLAAGWTLVAVGGALLVLPGPGIPLVLGGLALLAPHARWARRAQERIRATLRRASGRRSDAPAP